MPFRPMLSAWCAALIMFAGLAPAVGALDLLEPAASGAGLKTIQPEALREAPVVLNREALAALARLGEAKAKGTAATDSEGVRVHFFPGADFDLLPETAESDEQRVRVQGQVAGRPLAQFTIAVVEEAAAMDLTLPDGRVYQLRYAGDGLHVVREIEQGRLDPCGLNDRTIGRFTAKPGSAKQAADPLPLAADPAALDTRGVPRQNDLDGNVDVLVLYTAQARQNQGGTNGMLALIDLAVTNANLAYQNSGVGQSMALVYAAETPYVASMTDMVVDLDALSNSGDGQLDDVFALRDLYRADYVMLMTAVSTGGTCGIAWQYAGGAFSSTFSVTAASCVSNETFAHELGHNMGCGHGYGDDGATPSAAFRSYSRGHRWTGSSSNNYRSVMAYAPGTRVKYFSNPNVLYDGVATGVNIGEIGEAHNASSLVEARNTSANHRLSNDHFINRIALPAGYWQISGTTANRSRESGEPQHAGQPGARSAWWSWTALQSNATTVSLQGSSFDTLLGLYTGTTLGGLTPVASNDDVGGGQTWSRVTFSAVAGTTYQIAVDTKSSTGGKVVLGIDAGGSPILATDPTNLTIPGIVNSGAPTMLLRLINIGGGSTPYAVTTNVPWLSVGPSTGTLEQAPLDLTVGTTVTGLAAGSYPAQIQITAPEASNTPLNVPVTLTLVDGPLNDLFQSAFSLSGASGTTTGTNVEAGVEPGEPSFTGGNGLRSVWWRWQAASTGWIEIDTIDSSFDTLLGVYTGSTVDALTEIATNDDIDTTRQSRVAFQAQAGTVYHIAISGYQGATGQIQLNWAQAPNAVEPNWAVYP